jgi:hypothetical protein
MLNQAEGAFDEPNRISYEAIPYQRCVKSGSVVYAVVDFNNMLRFTDAARSRFQAESLTVIQVASR